MKPEAKCQSHLERIGICSLETLKEHIIAIFGNHIHQGNVLIDIYGLALPDWDQIKKIEGYPEAGRALWEFICDLFIEFDRKHHPDCFKGGAWMNTGFSVNSQLGPWEINLENCKVVMK